MYINRRILLVVILFAVSTVLVPMSAQGQAPDPAVGEFLEAKIQEPTQFMRAFDVSPTSVTASSGLQRWYVQPAITESDVRYPSLVPDAGDTLHLAYYDYPALSLGYAKYDGSVWHIQLVDTVSTFVPSPQLAVDTVGRPHIIYCDGSAYDCVSLKYAYYDGSVWRVKAVAGTGTVYSKSNLEVDSNKHLHFSYIDIDSHTLKYARYDGSSWHIETVGSAQPGSTLIALDSADFPHIVYANNNSTMHTYYDGMIWQVEVLDSPGALTEQYASFALDSVDQLHIAYYNQNQNHELIYAYYAAGTWYSQTVTQVGYNTTPLILKLDRADQPHILYRQLGSSWTDLFYIHRENSTWQFEIVASNIGYYALAIDNEDRPNIVYGIGALYYARREDDPSSWSALAFASYRDMNFEVYTADGDGSNPVRRTVHGATDYTPEYNYGATKLVFVSNRDGNLEIYTMNADGTNLARLTANGAGDYLPTWSPDSSKIAFYSLRDGNAEIYVMNANGTVQTRLTSNGAWDGHPTWSPDGSKIAYVSNRSGSYELWVMNTDGSNQRQLSSGLGTAAYPDWSPDGSRIAFNRDANGDGWLDLAVINADGTGLQHPLGNSLTNYDYLAPTWSPNGVYLAYAKLQWINYYGNWYWVDSYINYTLNLDPNYVYRLTDSGYDWWPDWQSADAVPPSSKAFSLMWSASPTFTVQWSGYDNGPSGISSYDVQYRDGVAGVWTGLMTETMQTKTTFAGEYGHMYYFRSRARDVAGNIELYPAGDGDTSTHVYRYSLSGHVLGNRDQPVVAAMQIMPSALNTTISDAQGEFEFYSDDAGIYSVTASNPHFGLQPPMKHISVPGTLASPVFYLPPADNVIVDGDFESGNLTVWIPTGDILPIITSTAHTGDGALMLGGSGAATFIAPGGWRSTVEQEVAIPTTITETTFSLLYRVAEADPAHDRLEVTLVGPTQTITMTLPLTVTGWTHHWWELSSWRDSTATVRVAWYQSEMTRTAGIVLDEISLGSSVQGAYAVYLPVVFRNH